MNPPRTFPKHTRRSSKNFNPNRWLLLCNSLKWIFRPKGQREVFRFRDRPGPTSTPESGMVGVRAVGRRGPGVSGTPPEDRKQWTDHGVSVDPTLRILRIYQRAKNVFFVFGRVTVGRLGAARSRGARPVHRRPTPGPVGPGARGATPSPHRGAPRRGRLPLSGAGTAPPGRGALRIPRWTEVARLRPRARAPPTCA